MRWVKANLAKILGVFIILGIAVASFLVVTVFSIGIATQLGIKVPPFSPLISAQRVFYYGGYRNIWQYLDECAEQHRHLIYQPRMGKCQFSNIEFETELTFNSEGRNHDALFDASAKRIAVLGDSHAMGWGVDDNETFSARLQSLTKRRVYNLGVSSYATERELDRLLTIENLDDIDTIIIQYTDNDLRENNNYPIDKEVALTRYQTALDSYGENPSAVLANSFFTAFKALFPRSLINSIKVVLGREPSFDLPTGHRKGVENILEHYAQFLQSKHVIVFFLSGNNSFAPVSEDWVGPYAEHGLNVDFVELNFEEEHFYQVDDHLNAAGHSSIAQQIKNNFLN